MANTKQIVLSGYYGFDNIGDEAVLYSIVSLLKKEIPSVTITVLSNNPEKTKALYRVESVNRWDIKAVAKVIKKSDLLISGGGSLLQDITSSKTIPYYLAIVKIAQFYKKKVVFYSQGVGPVNKGISRWLMRRVINKVDGIFVRDADSKVLLEQIGIKKPIDIAIDPVLGIKLPNRKIADENAVGVYIRPWQGEEFEQRLISSMEKGLLELVEKGYKICFIPMYYDQDVKISQNLMKALESKLPEQVAHTQLELIEHMLSIEEVLDYTASFKMVIGMRLHSLIMAAATNVPMLGISYDPKVEAFMKEMNNELYIDIDCISSEKFSSYVQHLEKNLEQLKNQLELNYKSKEERIYLPVHCIKKLLGI